MAPVDFKLSKPVRTPAGAPRRGAHAARQFESTRRASFPEQPSWLTLAARIGYLYELPEERVGVSYTDSDGGLPSPSLATRPPADTHPR
jgi:hypothetical protein